jgi:hypothetical protein
MIDLIEKWVERVGSVDLTAVVRGDNGSFKLVYPEDESLKIDQLPILLLGQDGTQSKWMNSDQVNVLLPGINTDQTTFPFLLTYIPLGLNSSLLLLLHWKNDDESSSAKSWFQKVVTHWLSPLIQGEDWKSSALRLINQEDQPSSIAHIHQQVEFIQFLLDQVNSETGAGMTLEWNDTDLKSLPGDPDWRGIHQTLMDFARIDPSRVLSIKEVWRTKSGNPIPASPVEPAGSVRTKPKRKQPSEASPTPRKVPFYGVPSTLNRYEEAAAKAKETGRSIIGKVIGELSDPPLSAAAITDYVKKHKKEVMDWLGAYPEKWPIIRTEFTTIKKLEKERQSVETDSSTDKGRMTKKPSSPAD